MQRFYRQRRTPVPHYAASIRRSIARLKHLAGRLAVAIDDALAAADGARQYAIGVDVPRLFTRTPAAGAAYRIFRDAHLPGAVAGQTYESRMWMDPSPPAIRTLSDRCHHLLLASPITGLAARLGRQKIKRIFSSTLAEGAIYLNLLQTNLTRCHPLFLYVKH